MAKDGRSGPILSLPFKSTGVLILDMGGGGYLSKWLVKFFIEAGRH